MKLSFIIPCYGSENTIEDVILEIESAVEKNVLYEIIAVDDCSPDNVLFRLQKLATNNHAIKVISLAKNAGKHSAMMAGYKFATGDIIVNLDDDGQCPVNRLWDLIEPLENGYDISIARYKEKRQSSFKNIGSHVNAVMACWLLNKPACLQLSNFSAFKSFVRDEILKYEHAFPYIDGLMLRTTSKITNVDMEERERKNGESGYTLIKSLKLFFNGFTSFSVKPLRLATVLGCVIAFVGFVMALVLIVRRIAFNNIVVGYTSIISTNLLLGGLIMLLLGVIGEYVGRIYICINRAPQYVIRDTINCENLSEVNI